MNQSEILNQLTSLVYEMRKAQKAFFRTRQEAQKQTAIKLEKKVDEFIQLHCIVPDIQTKLF